MQRKYLDYQVNVGNRIIEVLQRGGNDATEQAQSISQGKNLFQNIIDNLFKETGKSIIRSENEIRFTQLGEVLSPYQLSSGEKQMLVILLTVLVEDCKPYVLFMDEPEVSLHFEWQKQLIDLILQLNPNVQLILATHSPAVIMNGWMDHVTEVTDIHIIKDISRQWDARLRDNITSNYFKAANRLTSKYAKRKIVAYVESYEDVFFWRTILSQFETQERFFEVMLPTRSTHLERGKKAAISSLLKPLDRI